METYLVLAKVSNPVNPKVFLYLTIGGQPAGRLTLELYADIAPKTAENFRCLCTGEKGIGEQEKPLHYKGSKFHWVEKNCFAAGGKLNSTHYESIYGLTFPVENFSRRFMKRGDLAMFVDERKQCDSAFVIAFRPHPEWNG